MRDIENDRNSGKNTMVVRMGSDKAKIYHVLLILVGMLASVLFALFQFRVAFKWIFLLAFPLFIRDVIQIWRVAKPRDFDPFLKRLSLTTLLFSVLFGLGIFLS